jgi:ribosome maturation factor RimP
MAKLPEGYQEFGEYLIRQAAAKQCGISSKEDLSIEWKPGRIIVTVLGNVYVSNDMDDVDDEEEIELEQDEAMGDDGDAEGFYDDEGGEFLGDDGDDEEEEEDLFEEEEEEDSVGLLSSSLTSTSAGQDVDVSQLAKAINAALDDGGTGLAIAETHEIEVTTPGASDELTSAIMFEAYRGFEVICQFMDPKTKKTKTIDGRLVERNDEFTVVNIKGRMKKLKNDMVVSVKLPKAKKEKGVA